MSTTDFSKADIPAFLARLQERLVAADVLGQACMRAIASGEVDPNSALGAAAAGYAQAAGLHLDVAADVEVRSAWFPDEPVLLSAALRGEFVPGYRFHVVGRRIMPGWGEGRRRGNLVVEDVEFDGQAAVALFQCQEDLQEAVQRESANRDRARLEKAAREQLRASRLAFDRQLCVPIQREYQMLLNSHGSTDLDAYLDRIVERRFPNTVVAYMADGASLYDAGPRASKELEDAFRKKAEAMTKRRKYRSAAG